MFFIKKKSQSCSILQVLVHVCMIVHFTPIGFLPFQKVLQNLHSKPLASSLKRLLTSLNLSNEKLQEKSTPRKCFQWIHLLMEVKQKKTRCFLAAGHAPL